MELRTQLKVTMWAGMAALIAVAVAMAVFVVNANSRRDEVCDIIRDTTHAQTEALITATEPDNLTPEEQAARDKAVNRYRDLVDEALAECQ